MNKIAITENVAVENLNNYDVIVSNTSDEQYVSITGAIEPSNNIPGTMLIETNFGCLYLSPEYTVRAGNFIDNNSEDFAYNVTTLEANGKHAVIEIDVNRVILQYEDAMGRHEYDNTPYQQPLTDVTEVGTLIDPETGEDMALVAAYLIKK